MDAAAPTEVVEDIVEIVEVLTRVGSVAPQGWSSLHAEAQSLFDPQPTTHWVLYSVQRVFGGIRGNAIGADAAIRQRIGIAGVGVCTEGVASLLRADERAFADLRGAPLFCRGSANISQERSRRLTSCAQGDRTGVNGLRDGD